MLVQPSILHIGSLFVDHNCTHLTFCILSIFASHLAEYETLLGSDGRQMSPQQLSYFLKCAVHPS